MRRILLGLCVLVASGCMTFPDGPTRPAPAAGEALPAKIRVHLASHPPRVLDAPTLRGDSITGLLEGTEIAWGVSLADVVGVDHRQVDTKGTVFGTLAVAFVTLLSYTIVQFASGGYS